MKTGDRFLLLTVGLAVSRWLRDRRRQVMKRAFSPFILFGWLTCGVAAGWDGAEGTSIAGRYMGLSRLLDLIPEVFVAHRWCILIQYAPSSLFALGKNLRRNRFPPK
jgi:hypothetical protein